MHFAPAESGKAYLGAVRHQVVTHIRPLAYIRIGTASFGWTPKDAPSGDGDTGFGRIVERLDIRLTNALTPQAMGRVDRVNQSLPSVSLASAKLTEALGSTV